MDENYRPTYRDFIYYLAQLDNTIDSDREHLEFAAKFVCTERDACICAMTALMIDGIDVIGKLFTWKKIIQREPIDAEWED